MRMKRPCERCGRPFDRAKASRAKLCVMCWHKSQFNRQEKNSEKYGWAKPKHAKFEGRESQIEDSGGTDESS